MLDLNTAGSFSTNFPINLSTALGAETAYVGFTGADGGVASTQVVSNYTFVPLPSLLADQPTAGSIPLSWPASIGGYTMQSKSNLAAILEPWQNVTNPVVQITNRNRVTVTPQLGADNYRLRINLNE